MAGVTTAVVLAGGAGLRLRPLTKDLPKAMMPVAGRPLLEWILIWLRRNGVKRVIVGVAYKKDRIIDYFGTRKAGLRVEYSVHTVEGDTVEGFGLAISRFVDDETFLGMNGDELTNINVSRFYRTLWRGFRLRIVTLRHGEGKPAFP